MAKPTMTDEMVMLSSLSDEFQMSIIRELHRDYVVAFVEMHERPNALITGKRFLWGVPFYEIARNGRIERIRCHGRQSIYGKAYEAIVRGNS